MTIYLSDRTGASIDAVLDNADTLLTPATGETVYHTGNTGFATFDSTTYNTTLPTTTGLNISASGFGGTIQSYRGVTSSGFLHEFFNPNGKVGSIAVSGVVTSFNTSSDPRLKDFKDAPLDTEINTEFDALFSCFRVFNWKNDPDGDLVWGFDAHACIDAKTNLGSEGDGSRELNLGDIYDTTPAVTEDRVVLDSDGNATTEIETVVVKEAIEHKVTPAGVDQSKAVPILLAKIEQLERRLATLEA